MVYIRPAFAAAVALVFVGALMSFPAGSAQSGTPADCSAANLNNWWGYQYNQQVRSTWDSYSSQSRGVCVMREAGLPIPGECKFTVQSPWWVASGTPASPPLCWWGTPTTPAVQVTSPAGCFATSLSSRQAYSNPATRELWDYYTAQTVGVCESIGRTPGDCRFIVQEQAGKWLCWWPAKGGAALKQVLDRSAYERLSAAALAVPEICDLVGKGTAVIEFRVGAERVQIQVKDCRLVDIQWLTPPDGCRDIEPSRYAAIVGQGALDAGLAGAADVCLLPRAPTQGECTTSIPIAASSYLCFYGKKTGATRGAVAAFTGAAKFFIVGDKGAIRAILNSPAPADTTRELVCDGNLVMNAEAPADQIKLRVALSGLLEDRICANVNIEPAGPVTVWEGVEGKLYLDLGGLGAAGGIQVLNKDGSALGYLPGSIIPAGTDPFSGPMVPASARDNVLSQSPGAVDHALAGSGLPASNGRELGGLATFASLLSGQDPGDILAWWHFQDAEYPGLQWNGNALQSIFPAAGGPILIGPNGPVVPAGAPPPGPDLEDTVLDDITECIHICSAPAGSGAFGPSGAPYLGGALSGLDARNALLAQGLVGAA